MYLLRTDCQWRQLLLELPPWQSIFYHFSKWQKEGNIQQMHDFFRDKTRKLQGKEKGPSLGAVDSQSIKSSEQTESVRYDAGKKVKGIKTHIVVDRLDLLLNLCVLPVNIQDRNGVRIVLVDLRKKYPRIKKVNTDCAYAGRLGIRTEEEQEFELEIVRKKRDLSYCPSDFLLKEPLAGL